MATIRTCRLFGLVVAAVLPLLATSSASAQTQGYYYPYMVPWGAYYYRPAYIYYPGPVYPPPTPVVTERSSPIVRTSAVTPAAYAAPARDDDSRPSYYSEDYSGPEGPTNEPSKLAYIRVRVPADAELWLNGEKRSQRGTVREFATPALDPDRVYVYNVRARWTEEGGINVEKTLRVRTISGTRVMVNFVRPPAEQPRRITRAPVAPGPAPRAPIQQQPVDWTSGSVAPRSLPGPRP